MALAFLAFPAGCALLAGIEGKELGSSAAPGTGGTGGNDVDAGGGPGYPPGCGGTDAACGAPSGLQEGAPWPMPGFCATRIGRSPYEVRPSDAGNPDLAVVHESPPVQPGWLGSPVISADGTVFVGGSDDTPLFAFATDGSYEWVLSSVVYAHCLVIGSDGTVYALVDQSGDIVLHAVDPADASAPAWSQPLTTDVLDKTCPIIGSDGTIYLSAGQCVYAVRPTTHDNKWAPQCMAAMVNGGLSIAADGTILVPGADGTLRALDPDSGAQQWDIHLSSDPLTSAALVAPDHSIFVGSGAETHGALFAVDPCPSGGPRASIPFPTNGKIYQGAVGNDPDGTLYVPSDDGYVRALTFDGVEFYEKWSYWSCGRPRGGVVVDKAGTVFVSVMDNDLCGGVHALDPDTGDLLSMHLPNSALGGITTEGLLVAPHHSDAGLDMYTLQFLGWQ